jgi:carbamoyltransferase
MKTGYILGISCGYHDSAVSLVHNGDVLYACEEERFTGIKHDFSFPTQAINSIFKKFKISNDDLDSICFYENPEFNKQLNEVVGKTFLKEKI